jgi:zinc transport system ATP-binding protein
MQNIIEVKNLSFGYDAREILSGIDFTLAQGDFAGIIGPNGSGKSTFLKLLLGLLRPTGGSISLFGVPSHKFRDWPKIGYLAQKNQFHTGFPASVYEVVASSLYSQTGVMHTLSRQQKERVRSALSIVGLLSMERSPISHLSGGQQQRMHLARVLVNNPEILLLDEPSSGMDTASENAMYELLHTLNKEKNISIVMVTHDITAVTAHAGRMLCMSDGRMTEHDVSAGVSDDFLSSLYGHSVHAHVHSDEHTGARAARQGD